MEKVTVFLTKAQKQNLEKGKTIQLKSTQLKSTTGDHNVELHMSKRHHNKIMRAMSRDKGIRLLPQMVGAYSIDGGSLIGSLTKAAKSAGKWVAHNVPKEMVKQGLNAAAMAGSTMIGHPELGLLANQAIEHGVDAAYNHKDKRKSVKDHARDSAQDFAELYAQQHYPKEFGMYQTAKQIHKDYGGYNGNGLKKGSLEAKERMAKIRSMRKTKGGSIIGDLKNAFDPKKNGVAKTYNNVKTTVAPYIRPAITHALAAGIDAATGSPIGSLATPGIKRGVDASLDKANIGIGLSRRKIHTRYGGLIKGIPTPILTNRARDMINTSGLIGKKLGTENGLAKVGGSFLPL